MTINKESYHNKDHIVFLGESSFPVGMAAVHRMTLMGKALLCGDYKVTVICRKGVLKKGGKYDFATTGSFEGIHYIYTTDSIFKPKGFFKRNFAKLKGMLTEYSYLKQLKKAGNLKAAIISNHNAHHILRYRIYGTLIGFPIILNFVELASAMKSRDSRFHKINDYLFDNQIIKIVDGALPISNVLIDYYKDFSPSKPILKLPILCDFKKFDLEKKPQKEVTFLYCGASSYMELIEFVIHAFDNLTITGDTIFLHLILGGTEGELKKVREKIDQAKNRKNIRLIPNVPHKNIPEHFCNATALLIPLRPTLQDAARFPHKIGEYLASGRPMITTRYGEIKNYDFNDLENTLVADSYDESAFAEKMEYILKNPEKAEEIGAKGRQMGLANFEYSRYGPVLRDYFSSFENVRTK